MDGMFAIEKGRDGIAAGGYKNPGPCRHVAEALVAPAAGAIKHGPIRKPGMDEGMTMVFRAQDSEPRKAVKAGVKFEAEDAHEQMTATEKTKTTNENTRK